MILPLLAIAALAFGEPPKPHRATRARHPERPVPMNLQPSPKQQAYLGALLAHYEELRTARARDIALQEAAIAEAQALPPGEKGLFAMGPPCRCRPLRLQPLPPLTIEQIAAIAFNVGLAQIVRSGPGPHLEGVEPPGEIYGMIDAL